MKISCVAILGLAAVFAPAVVAESVAFSFDGNGITANGVFTIGPQSTNSTTPPGEEITGISGTFSDANVNVSGSITGLVTPITYVNLPPVSGFATTPGGLSYDDLYYPAGDSPLVCYDLINNVPTLTYPFSGGVLDIYGVAFNIAGPGGYVGEIWSNGDVGGGPIVYAAGLANGNNIVDLPNATPGPDVPPPGEYGSFTTSSVPEPGSLFLLGIGLTGLLSACAYKRNGPLPERR